MTYKVKKLFCIVIANDECAIDFYSRQLWTALRFKNGRTRLFRKGVHVWVDDDDIRMYFEEVK